MNTHSIDLTGYYARSHGSGALYLGTAGSHGNEQLQVTQGKGWEGLTVQVVFHPSHVAVQLPANGLLDVPWEATAQPLTAVQGRIVFQGFDQDRLVNSTDLAYTVASHSPALGRDEEPYTPGIVEGVLNQMTADKDAILSAAQQTGQAKEAAAASANQAAGSATSARQSAGAANTSAGQAAASASQAAGSAAAAGETLTQVQTAGQEAQQKVKDAETAALDKIAAAAPALPAVSADAVGQSVTVKPDGTGYNLAALAPLEATIRPTVTGSPAVCENSIPWGLQGLKIYGKSVQDGIPSPDNPVSIVNAGASGSIVLRMTDGASQSQSYTLATPNGLPGIPVTSGGNYTDESGQQWACDVIDYAAMTKTENTRLVRLDSSLNWIDKWNASYFIEGTFFVYTMAFNDLDAKINGSMCSHFTYLDDNILFNSDIGMQSGRGNGFNIAFRVPSMLINSLDEWNAWLDSHEVYLMLALANPITTPLSAEKFAAYRAMTAYSGTTVVSAAEPVAGLEVRYVMDGNKYRESVDKRLAALEAAQTGI